MVNNLYFDLEPINNLKEFLYHIETLDKEGDWIFRGHKDSIWKLIPGTGRSPSKTYDEILKSWVYLRPNYTLKNYAQLVEFRNNLSEDLKIKLKDFSTFEREWLEIIIAQHHRLPTRLLDFTTNPMIALFFAVIDGTPEESDFNCVWCIKCNIFKTFDINLKKDFQNLTQVNPNNPELLKLIPINIDPRVPAQQSVFICFDDQYLSLDQRHRIITRNDIKRIRINKKYWYEILNELNKKGINKKSLLLDINELDEISQKIIEYFQK